MSQLNHLHDREPSDPTPEQIEMRSAEVRRGWSRRVAARRVTQMFAPWSPPLVYTTELVREINSRQD